MTSTKSAIVTGSSRGIGAAIAKRLATDGFAIVVNYAGRAADADEVVKEITDAGGTAIAVQADVSSPDDVATLFTKAEEAFGGVDVVVNNAGVIQPGLVPVIATDDTLFDRMLAINLKGTFNVLRTAGTKLRDGGRIVNFSTSVVGLTLPGYATYAATKAAVETMTTIFAKELRGRHITVNAVAPGPTATDLFFTGKTEEQIAHLAKMPPLERLGKPEDIAGVVSFLCGPDGGWVNGQTIRSNGGIV
ncbi:SDR family oxidoreductase [Luteolibacter ambystomatis]|uniref:SDR family oxidoreductase n=1 Tax=Luteolibacter ambystomatis TaxID=2824561 RepID=A0A975PH57_9BACT|nr:SDR family oxidoreductase [Luteolibacter ambystomatis]QUE52946.1 SDR family oxidoreductase [Luteolibacter ambystomatis]